MDKFRLRIITFIIITLYAGFIVTIVTSYYVSKNSLSSQIDDNMLPLTSDNIYTEINRDLLTPIFISSVMANDTFLKDWIISGEEDVDKITKFLKNIKVKYNTVTSFFVSDKSRIYYQAEGVLKNISKNNTRDEWFFRSANMDSDYEINIDFDMANNDEITVFINHKVFDYNGKLIGVTGVGLTLNKIKYMIDSYMKKYSSNVFFIDTEGNIKLTGTGAEISDSSIHKLMGLSSLSDKILKNKQARLVYIDNNNIKKHLFSRYIPEFKWFLIVEKEEGEFFQKLKMSLFLNLAISTVLAVIIFFFIQSQMTHYQNKLEKLATHDPLTSVLNRRGLQIVFQEIFNEIGRIIDNVSILIVDIDYFKNVNDKYGHAAGDVVLKKLPQIIRKNIRTSDIICRWGGDEFIILLKNCDKDNSLKIAEKIRREINYSFMYYKGRTFKTSATIGISLYEKDDDLDRIIEKADKALYKAKYNGRNRCEITD
jgi:diguanylate cyclase (GGDEF)-like protein